MKRSITFGTITTLAIFGAVLTVKAKRADPARPAASSEKDFGYAIEMLSSNKNGLIEGTGGVPIHFKARHKAFVAGPYQLVARARTLTWEVVAEHFFDRYVAGQNEERRDELETTLDLPPGKYMVEVELLSLYPVQDVDGNKIAEHLGQGNNVYIATSHPVLE